jgi:tetratricopeptide (TPR) repeat protein
MHRFIFLLFLSPVIALGQYDTLLTSALSVRNDTERVNRLYSYGFQIRNTDPQLAYEFASHAEDAAKKCKSAKHIAKSYNLLGILYYKKGNYKAAIHYHKQALQLRSKINDVLGIAHSNTNLGNVYSDLKLYTNAENFYLKALDAYKQLNEPNKVINCLINLGTLKHYLKQYDEAIENYTMARKMIAINDYDMLSMCLSNLAEAYLGKGDFEKALSLSQDALKLRDLTENKTEAGESYNNIGGIFIIKKEFDKAKENLDSALSIADAYDYTDLKLRVRKNLAYYYSETGDFKNGFRWLDLYCHLRDSLQIEQELTKSHYDFDEHEDRMSTIVHTNNFRHSWFLILTGILFVGIPFILIQFRR